MKTKSFKDIKAKHLKNKEFAKQYGALEDEFVIAREVLTLRKKRNMTQAELADLIGTSQPAIARLESGNYENLSLSFLKRVADALGAQAEFHIREKTA